MRPLYVIYLFTNLQGFLTILAFNDWTWTLYIVPAGLKEELTS